MIAFKMLNRSIHIQLKQNSRGNRFFDHFFFQVLFYLVRERTIATSLEKLRASSKHEFRHGIGFNVREQIFQRKQQKRYIDHG